MGTTKFTTGTWKLEGGADGGWLNYTAPLPSGRMSSGALFEYGLVSQPTASLGETAPQIIKDLVHRANVAPELYAALVDARATLVASGWLDGGLTKIDAALAKARGEGK